MRRLFDKRTVKGALLKEEEEFIIKFPTLNANSSEITKQDFFILMLNSYANI